jgi:hypothetical protein
MAEFSDAEVLCQKLRAREGVKSVSRAGRMVLLDTQQGAYFGLNALGGRIWSTICDGRRLPDLVDDICGDHSVARGVVEADVADCTETVMT